MKIMLCGAADVNSYLNEFIKVLSGFGADQMSYIDATISHEDVLTGSAVANSRTSVKEADICVFVIKEKYGTITWNEEMDEAWWGGKPMLVFCHENIYTAYNRHRDEPDEWGASDKAVFTQIHNLEYDRSITLIPFADGEFGNQLKKQLAERFREYANEHERTQSRKNIFFKLKSGSQLSMTDINNLIETAKDEYELKNIRKDAVRVLASKHCLDAETVLDLMRSQEQGISRLTCDCLDQMLRSTDDYTQDFLNECVDIMNESDDTGVERRLIKKLLEIDVKKGIKALLNLDMVEIGTKRRLAAALRDHKDDILINNLQAEAIYLAEECCKTAQKGWKGDCEKLIEELKI